MSTQSQLISWSISRMRRIVELWTKLDLVDKSYMLRRIRDKEPTVFYAIADEKVMDGAMTDAGEKLAERVTIYRRTFGIGVGVRWNDDLVVHKVRDELEWAAEIADDCQCDRSAKCSCADHAAAIRKLKE